MEVIHYTYGDTFELPNMNVACIGYFDGLHKGHQKLIEKVLVETKEHQISTLITFEPDPWEIIKKMSHIPQVLPMKKRIELGEKLGIKRWIIIQFDEQLASLQPQEFIGLLKTLNLDVLVCGFDFRFGFQGVGTISFLREHAPFQVIEVEKYQIEGIKVSTTKIEELIQLGEIEIANHYLGHNYRLEGIVVEGNQRGRTIDFPTANLYLQDDYCVPQVGVYICRAMIHGKTYEALMNIGHNPTFNYREQLSIEVHLFNFDEMIYGELLEVEVLQRLRTERKFSSIDALVAQLKEDVKKTKTYFSNIT